MSEEYSLKELYQVLIKPTQNIEIGGKTVVAGEVIASFDKISLANFNELKHTVTAHGGYMNADRVWWEDSKGIDLTFSQGVFSNSQWALMANAKLLDNQINDLWLSEHQALRSDIDGNIKVKHPINIQDTLRVYNKQTGDLINPIKVEDDTIQIAESNLEVIVDYSFVYSQNFSTLKFGQYLTNGFFTLEGRTRVKDDNTGKVRTGIIYIPKLKLMSDLSMRLGRDASPVVGTIRARACATGEKSNNRAMIMYLLDDDIDADI